MEKTEVMNQCHQQKQAGKRSVKGGQKNKTGQTQENEGKGQLSYPAQQSAGLDGQSRGGKPLRGIILSVQK